MSQHFLKWIPFVFNWVMFFSPVHSVILSKLMESEDSRVWRLILFICIICPSDLYCEHDGKTANVYCHCHCTTLPGGFLFFVLLVALYLTVSSDRPGSCILWMDNKWASLATLELNCSNSAGFIKIEIGGKSFLLLPFFCGAMWLSSSVAFVPICHVLPSRSPRTGH